MQLAKTITTQKQSATHVSRDLGQKNWVESASFKGYVEFMQSRGYSMVQFERMLDSVIADYCATFGSYVAPIQVKSARGPPGTQVQFHVNKADGAAGGRYEDHILICLIINSDVEDNGKDFDQLPSVDLLEAYIMKSSDIKTNFKPIVYDHKPGSKRGRENAYEEFRYVLDRDNPEKLDKLMKSLESNITDIHTRRAWTRDACFFTFGDGSPNTKVAKTQQTELRGMKAVSDALAPFQARAPLRQGETVDILFWHHLKSVRISLKTATYSRLNRQQHSYVGFNFMLSKAPNSHHCDIVVAVQFDMNDRTQVVSAYVFDAKDIYKTGMKSFYWNKYDHTDKMFDMTIETGKQALKQRVSLFMKTDEERSAIVKK